MCYTLMQNSSRTYVTLRGLRMMRLQTGGASWISARFALLPCVGVFRVNLFHVCVDPWGSPGAGCITGLNDILPKTVDGPRHAHGLHIDDRARRLCRSRRWFAGSDGSSRRTSMPNAGLWRSSG